MNDSIWATVLGIARTFNMSQDEALYGISYVNALMYSRAVPMPDDEKEDDAPLFDEGKDMNNPANFEDFDNEEVVRT